jgi:hypothetical protein
MNPQIIIELGIKAAHEARRFKGSRRIEKKAEIGFTEFSGVWSYISSYCFSSYFEITLEQFYHLSQCPNFGAISTMPSQTAIARIEIQPKT